MNKCVIFTPIGNIKIVEKDGEILYIRKTKEKLQPPTTELLRLTAEEYLTYFKKKEILK